MHFKKETYKYIKYMARNSSLMNVKNTIAAGIIFQIPESGLISKETSIV